MCRGEETGNEGGTSTLLILDEIGVGGKNERCSAFLAVLARATILAPYDSLTLGVLLVERVQESGSGAGPLHQL